MSGGQREREREIGIFRTIFSLFLFGMFLTIETKSNCRFESNIPSQKRRERRRDSFFFSNFCPVRWYIYLWWSMEKKNIKVFFFFFLCSRKFAGRVFPPFRPHHSDRSQIFVPFFFFSLWFQIFDQILWSESKILSFSSSSCRFSKTDMKKMRPTNLDVATSPVVSPPHFYNRLQKQNFRSISNTHSRIAIRKVCFHLSWMCTQRQHVYTCIRIGTKVGGYKKKRKKMMDGLLNRAHPRIAPTPRR